MPGPPQDNPFPQGTLSQIWDVIATALQTDPVLQSAVNTMQFWSGDPADLAEPSDENMPFLRMTPMVGQSSWLDENAHQFRWPLKIELGIIGTDVRIMMDYWECLRRALFTGNTVLYQLYPFEVIQKTLTSPAVEPHLWGDASGLSATAMLSILLRLHT